MSYFSEEEKELLARLICMSVREVVVADGEIRDGEFSPLAGSIDIAEIFPIPITGEVLKYIQEKGHHEYAIGIIKEINDDIDVAEEIIEFGKRVIENLNKKDKEMFLAGLYGILLETVHADGVKTQEESATVSQIMQYIGNVSLKDAYKMDKTWRKYAS
tara:strand:+ start:29 stop:505 length:477 start_codon:yes stop_codon:yes gene_type:complete